MTPGTAGGIRREGGDKTKRGKGGRGRGRRIRKVFVVRNRGKTRKDMSKDRRHVRINNRPLTPSHFPGHASFTPKGYTPAKLLCSGPVQQKGRCLSKQPHFLADAAGLVGVVRLWIRATGCSQRQEGLPQNSTSRVLPMHGNSHHGQRGNLLLLYFSHLISF